MTWNVMWMSCQNSGQQLFYNIYIDPPDIHFTLPFIDCEITTLGYISLTTGTLATVNSSTLEWSNPGRITWIIVLYTCATRETRKKGCFFEAERDSRESWLGDKMCLFMRKRVILDSIKGCLGSFFKLHQTCPPKKGVNMGTKSCEICV